MLYNSGPKEPCVRWGGADIARGMGNFGGCSPRPIEKHLEPLQRCMQKTTEPIEVPFGCAFMGARKHVLTGVKVGQIHSAPRWVTRW